MGKSVGVSFNVIEMLPSLPWLPAVASEYLRVRAYKQENENNFCNVVGMGMSMGMHEKRTETTGKVLARMPM